MAERGGCGRKALSVGALLGSVAGVAQAQPPASLPLLPPASMVWDEARFIDEKIKQGSRLHLLAKELGGMHPLEEFLRKGDPKEIELRLRAYGVRYYVHLNPPSCVLAPEAGLTAAAATPANAASAPACAAPSSVQPPLRGAGH
jgi:hypothetical protein